MIHRRGFIAGLGAFFAAPAIVRAASLMPVRALEVDDWLADVRLGPKWHWPPSNRQTREWLDIESIRDRNVILDLNGVRVWDGMWDASVAADKRSIDVR